MATYFQLIGSILEVIGVIMMANLYTRTGLKNFPMIFLSAIIRGKTARGVAIVSVIKKSDEEEISSNLLSLQGLSLIAFGFMFQAIGNLVTLFLIGA